ncbi:MAG TPA: type II toxin-antitoxin system VapC family toxin [Kaistia sp.]|nr:type II toxin-antitoxin system VapC family toxin [Kaistia sp.]
MSGFLLDTNVISMLSPARAEASAPFLEWLEQMDRDGRIFLSVVTIHEIEKGIALLQHKGATVKAAGLKVWLAGLVAAYDDKIVPVDALAAAFAGQLEAKAISGGHDPGMADATIAGIAMAHELVIVTLNAKHFLPFGIGVATPDEAARSPEARKRARSIKAPFLRAPGPLGR